MLYVIIFIQSAAITYLFLAVINQHQSLKYIANALVVMNDLVNHLAQHLPHDCNDVKLSPQTEKILNEPPGTETADTPEEYR